MNELKISIENSDCQVMLSEGMRSNFESKVESITKIADVHLLAQGKCGEMTTVRPAMFYTDVKTLFKYAILMNESFGPAGIVILVIPTMK